MDRLIYTAMSGSSAASTRQAVLANNLANVSTTGFRAQLATYRAVPLQGEGTSTRVFAVESTSGYLDTPGAPQHTDRPLDVMAYGNAWFGVQGLDGTEGYTRNGHLEVSPDGTLLGAHGLPALSSDGSPITVPAGAELSISPDGSISAKIGKQPANTIGRLKMITPTTEDPLTRSDDGLFRARSGEPVNNDDSAKLKPGVLEGSNVNPIETMVGMIQTARQFEASMRLLQSTESNDRSAAQLLGMQG
ncbi:MAG: flagellar basal body rod protein FlgF [Rhodoferax sp.]